MKGREGGERCVQYVSAVICSVLMDASGEIIVGFDGLG